MGVFRETNTGQVQPAWDGGASNRLIGGGPGYEEYDEGDGKESEFAANSTAVKGSAAAAASAFVGGGELPNEFELAQSNTMGQSIQNESKLPSIIGLVHPYDSSTDLAFPAIERMALDRFGKSVGIEIGGESPRYNTTVSMVHSPHYSLLPSAMYTGSDDHLRRTGVAFATLDLELQRRMALLVLGSCGNHRSVFVRTTAVRGSHAIISHGFSEAGR